MKVSSLAGPHTPVSKTPRPRGLGQSGSIRPDRLHSAPCKRVQNLPSLQMARKSPLSVYQPDINPALLGTRPECSPTVHLLVFPVALLQYIVRYNKIPKYKFL